MDNPNPAALTATLIGAEDPLPAAKGNSSSMGDDTARYSRRRDHIAAIGPDDQQTGVLPSTKAADITKTWGRRRLQSPLHTFPSASRDPDANNVDAHSRAATPSPLAAKRSWIQT